MSHIYLVRNPTNELATYGQFRVRGEGVYGTVEGAHHTMDGTIELIQSIGRIEQEEWRDLHMWARATQKRNAK